VSEQFSALAFSPEQEFLVRERLFWSIHVALSSSWPFYLQSEKDALQQQKARRLSRAISLWSTKAIDQIFQKVKYLS
jgi:hypothetical protein